MQAGAALLLAAVLALPAGTSGAPRTGAPRSAWISAPVAVAADGTADIGPVQGVRGPLAARVATELGKRRFKAALVDGLPVAARGEISGRLVIGSPGDGTALAFEQLRIVPRLERIRPPRFPREMYEARQAGQVELRAWVSPDGRIVSLQTVSASSAAFEQAARQSLSSARFEASSIGADGQVSLAIPFVFHLGGADVTRTFACELDERRPSIEGQDGCLPLIEIFASPA